MLVCPPEDGGQIELKKGPNIKPLPEFGPLEDLISGPVMLKVGDDISTDDISPAGARVLPFRSNIPEISRFTFEQVDETFHKRAVTHQGLGFFVVAGSNYGQGSSREHAAIAPRFLGLRAVIARSFARIHRQNLANFGILGLTFVDAADYDRIQQGDVLELRDVRESIQRVSRVEVVNVTRSESYELDHGLAARQIEMVLAGSLINVVRNEHAAAQS